MFKWYFKKNMKLRMSFYQNTNDFIMQSFQMWGEATHSNSKEFSLELAKNPNFRDCIFELTERRAQLYKCTFDSKEKEKILVDIINSHESDLNNVVDTFSKSEYLNIVEKYFNIRRQFRFGFSSKVTLQDFVNMVINAFNEGMNPIRVTCAPMIANQILNHERIDDLYKVLISKGLPKGKFKPTMFLGDHTEKLSIEYTDLVYEYEIMTELDNKVFKIKKIEKISVEQATKIALLKIQDVKWRLYTPQEPYDDDQIVMELVSSKSDVNEWLFQVFRRIGGKFGDHHFMWFNTNDLRCYYPDNEMYNRINKILEIKI